MLTLSLHVLPQDEESASGFSTMLEKQRFHRDIATAAESGCDFSTRWMRFDYLTN